MMKKLKNAKPSAIFQIVIVVLLFSYGGHPPANGVPEDMPAGAAIASKDVLPPASPAEAAQPNSSSSKFYFRAGQFAALSAGNGYFFKQYVVPQPDETGRAVIAPGLPISAVMDIQR